MPSAAEHVASNLAALRGLRGLSQVRFAKALGDLGHPTMHPSAIAKIELRTRDVTVEELVAFAAVLDVSPLRLLLPPVRAAGEPGLRVGQHQLDAWRAWVWCEQLEPWWEGDQAPEEQDPHGERLAAWHRGRVDDGTLEHVRYSPNADGKRERIVDASGGWRSVVDERERFRRKVAELHGTVAELRALLDGEADQ